jgi:hypothetical protein
LPAIADYALQQTGVQPLDDSLTPATDESCQAVHPAKTWEEARNELADELGGLIPTGCSYILVDQNQLGVLPLARRYAIPFIERGGRYWGPPANDASAIEELERLREAGPSSIVFAWPAFWWLDHYSGFHRHLRDHYRCLVRNERLVAFNLR